MRWNLQIAPDSQKVRALSKALGVESTLAKLLVQRGIETFEAAKAFFRPSLDQLHDPYLMQDMDLAVARIESAVQQGKCPVEWQLYSRSKALSVSRVMTAG